MSPTFPAAEATRTDARGRVAALAATALAVLAVPLAAPGPGLVPGSGPDAPGWLLGLYGDGLGVSASLYLGLTYAAIVAWVVLWSHAPRLGSRIVAALGLVLVAGFTLAPALHSLDVFSYISYGRLGVEGLNPYSAVPADLPGDAAASRVEDFRFTPSVYGPLFTALSVPPAAVSVPVAYWFFKLLAGASALLAGLLVARLARLRGVDERQAVAFVVLNPLVLIHLVGGAHNDGLMVAFALLGALWLASGREARAAAGLLAAVAVKVSGALYVPFALLGARSARRFAFWLAALGVAAAAASLALFGGPVTEAVSVASDNQDSVSRWSVPATVSRATGLDVDLLRTALAALYGLAVVALLAWVRAGGDWIRGAGWAAAGLLVATSWMVPWYLIWLLPLAAVARDRPLIVAAIGLTVFQAPNALPL